MFLYFLCVFVFHFLLSDLSPRALFFSFASLPRLCLLVSCCVCARLVCALCLPAAVVVLDVFILSFEVFVTFLILFGGFAALQSSLCVWLSVAVVRGLSVS